jgi:predicted RNA polymerase sigma factor
MVMVMVMVMVKATALSETGAPQSSTEARTALTLKMLGGLGTAEIMRAKRTLAEWRVPFEAPRAEERAASAAAALNDKKRRRK